MAKPLNKILKKVELFNPDSVSPASKKFAAKHEIEVTDDANGNGDDVFKAGKDSDYEHNMVNHGHDKDESKSVYEGYSKSAVDKEIKKDPRIKNKKAIHAILKGRQKTDEPIKKESVDEDTIKEGEVVAGNFGKKPSTKVGSAPATVSTPEFSPDAHKKNKFKKFAKALGIEVSDEDYEKARKVKLRGDE